MTARATLPTGHVGRSHADLLEELTVAARAHALDPHWDPTRTSGTPDHARGLLDALALALHVLWTYQEAWADEGALSNARLDASVWRLLALVGYRPDPGAAATGLQQLRAKDGATAVLPPRFRVTAPAVGDLPPATYETSRAITVRAELNEMRPFLPVLAGTPSSAGAISAAADRLARIPEVSVPGLRSFADTLGGRFEAGRQTGLAARNAARARQQAAQVADVLAQLRDAGAPDICGESYEALCAKLCETAALGAAVPDDLGPLSESQELLAALLPRMAERQPRALAGLEAALARADGEDDAGYSARLDQLTAFLDALVGGIMQQARDQVVRLRGTRALTLLDAQFASPTSARGIAPAGSDAFYLMPATATPDGPAFTQTDLLAPGDWLVLAEDPRPGAPAGTPRVYHEAVQVLRVRDEMPPGLGEVVSRVTVTPPLRRRHLLDNTVVLGNIAEVSHGVTTEETVVWRRKDGPLIPFSSPPVTWLSSVTPDAADGLAPEVEVHVAGREWHRTRDLRDAGPSDAAFAVEVDPQGRTSVRIGPGAPDGATVRLRYRSGLGASGNRAGRAVTTIAAAHPALLSTSNPLPMAGGADPEPADLARARADSGVHAVDRAVSLDDIAAVAEAVAGVQQAAVFRDAVRHRHHVTVVALGTAGHVLDEDELARLRAHLSARVPPGVVVRVQPHRTLPVSARLALRVLPGEDPLSAMAVVRRRLGAARPEPGERPGLLDPARSGLGVDVHASDIYGALGSIPGLASVHLEGLRVASSTASGRATDRLVVAGDAAARWASADEGSGVTEGLVLAWEEAREP